MKKLTNLIAAFNSYEISEKAKETVHEFLDIFPFREAELLSALPHLISFTVADKRNEYEFRILPLFEGFDLESVGITNDVVYEKVKHEITNYCGTEKVISLYKFHQLPDDVKEKVLDGLRTTEDKWWETTYEDAEQIDCKIKEFDIGRRNYISFASDGANTANKILKNHGETCQTYQIAKEFRDKVSVLELRQERAMDVMINIEEKFCDLEFSEIPKTAQRVYNYAAALQDSITEEIEELEGEFEHDLGEEYLSMLKREYGLITSDEYLIEHINANLYEFDEHGNIC